MAVKIVMGVSCSGKTPFIKKHFPEWKHHSIGALQRTIRQEFQEREGFGVNDVQVLIAANERMKDLVVEDLKAGYDVVMEHTLFKAKRRIGYVEAFKEVTNEPIDIYLLMPTDEELRKNVKGSPLSEDELEHLKGQIAEIEWPNAAEGFAHIYIVTEGVISEYFAEPNEYIIENAKKELAQEEAKEREAKAREKAREVLFEKMEKEGFWHYCEVCGRKERLNSKQAFEQGWDYPGMYGLYKSMRPNYGFGVLAPRTCGNCGIMDTIYMKLTTGKIGMNQLTAKEMAHIERVMAEPESLL